MQNRMYKKKDRTTFNKTFILELLFWPFFSGLFVGVKADQEFGLFRYWWLGFSSKGLVLTIVFFLITFVVLLVITTIKTDFLEHDEHGRRVSDVGTYGDAHLMTEDEIRSAYTVAPREKSNRLLYGALDKENKLYVSERMYQKDEKTDNKNWAYFASAGSGKTTAGLIPGTIRLAEQGENMIISDTKGEMYRCLGQYLEKQGYKVYMYSTKKEWMRNADRFNPMDFLEQDINKVLSFATFILDLAEEAKEETYFQNGEVALFVALCLFFTNPDITMSRAGSGNVNYIYHYLASTPVSKMSTDLNQLKKGYPGYEGAQAFINEKEAAQKDFVSGLRGKLQMYNSEDVANMTSFTDFEPLDFIGSKAVVFLVVDDRDPTFTPLTRCFLSMFINAIADIADNFPGLPEQGLKEGKVFPAFNIILEETNNIGKIDNLNRIISTVRGRNMNTILCFQNIQQLQTTYKGEDQSLLSACHTQIYFGVNDKLTAEEIESLLGYKSTVVESVRRSEGTITAVDLPLTEAHSYQEVKAPVLTADQIMRYTRDQIIVKTIGKSPMILWPILFMQNPLYKDIYNPKKEQAANYRLPLSKRPPEYYKYFGLPEPNDEERKEIKKKIRELIKPMDIDSHYKELLQTDIVQTMGLEIPQVKPKFNPEAAEIQSESKLEDIDNTLENTGDTESNTTPFTDDGKEQKDKDAKEQKTPSASNTEKKGENVPSQPREASAEQNLAELLSGARPVQQTKEQAGTPMPVKSSNIKPQDGETQRNAKEML